MLLVLDQVRKRYGSSWVLRDISLQLAAGHGCRIHGANGTGKSTLLRIAAGLSLCDSGRVQRHGAVSYIGHEEALLPDCTVAQNLAHLGRLDPMLDRGDLPIHLEGLGLQCLREKKVRTLSQGTRRKVSLVLQLSSAAPLVIADEPFAGLDEVSADYVRRRYVARLSQGACLLWTHHGADPLDGCSQVLQLGSVHA